jgi:hypothetical protein
MNPLIEKLEAAVPDTEEKLKEAKRLSDVPTVLKMTRLLRNQRVLLGLLKAHKEKRLEQAELELAVHVPE